MVQSRSVIFVTASLLFMLSGEFEARAEALIPLELNGSVSYTYSYAETENVQAEYSMLTASGAATGYVWQPWFMSIGLGLNIGLSKSTSSSDAGESASTAKSGYFSLHLFPQSRFPFYFAYSRNDSLIENLATSNPLEARFQSQNILLSQSYYARSGAFTLFTWNHNQFDTGDEDFEVDSLNLNYRMRHQYHRVSAAATYVESGRQTSSEKPNTLNLAADHSYLPGNELSVTSLFSHNVNNNDSAISPVESTVTQVSSNFSWRPDHKSYSTRGGVLLAHSETSQGGDASDRFSTTAGLTYRFTNRLTSTFNASASVSDYAGQQSTQTGGSANISYSSQQYVFAGFGYSFSAGGGVSTSKVDVSGQSSDPDLASASLSEDSANLGLGHGASQSWSVGQASSLSLGLSQSWSVSDSRTNTVDPSISLNQGINLGWNSRGESGTTFANVNLNESRTCDWNQVQNGDKSTGGVVCSSYKTRNQLLNGQISRSESLSRVSSLLGSVTYQVSTLSSIESEQEDSKAQSTSAQVTYRNSKAFGVFRLRLESIMEYSAQSNDATISDGAGTSKFSVKLAYNIGRLSTNLSFRVAKTGSGAESYGMNFGATRSF